MMWGEKVMIIMIIDSSPKNFNSRIKIHKIKEKKRDYLFLTTCKQQAARQRAHVIISSSRMSDNCFHIEEKPRVEEEKYLIIWKKKMIVIFSFVFSTFMRDFDLQCMYLHSHIDLKSLFIVIIFAAFSLSAVWNWDILRDGKKIDNFIYEDLNLYVAVY